MFLLLRYSFILRPCLGRGFLELFFGPCGSGSCEDRGVDLWSSCWSLLKDICFHWCGSQGPVTRRRFLEQCLRIERSFDILGAAILIHSESVYGSWLSGALLLTVWNSWEEDLPKKMMSIGSNAESCSGAGTSEGPPASAIWVSLTLEEQLANFKRINCKVWRGLDLEFLENVRRILEQLRIDPWVDVENLYPERFYFKGSTPLHWAVLIEDRTMVLHILTSGKVDINAHLYHEHLTALNIAIVGGNHDIVEDLLEHKADVCIGTEIGTSILYCMVQQKDSMFGILKRILASNVNMCDEGKNTTLHYAAQEKATDVVAYLIDQKANVNFKNQHGNTPLHFAAQKGFVDVMANLIIQKADVNFKNQDGNTPLNIVAKKHSLDGITCLLQQYIDVNTLGSVGDIGTNNALHLAVMAYGRVHNEVDIVKLLQECDVDANAKNSKGYSPFFAAVVRGHTEVVIELLQRKEKIKLMEECNGKTAIQIAFDNDHEHIKRALLECDVVSRYVGDLYRDRQVYVDAANAILVGAALIASVTFASWLQPPLGYTTSYFDLAPASSNVNYVDVQHNVSLRAFWIFNTLSFYFAIGTVVFGARSVLPSRKMFIKDIVVRLHQNLLVTSILLACSVFFVIIAFGIAGCIVLTPTLKFQWYMIVPTIFGGVVCLVSLGYLFKSMLEDYVEKKRETIVLF